VISKIIGLSVFRIKNKKGENGIKNKKVTAAVSNLAFNIASKLHACKDMITDDNRQKLVNSSLSNGRPNKVKEKNEKKITWINEPRSVQKPS